MFDIQKRHLGQTLKRIRQLGLFFDKQNPSIVRETQYSYTPF